MRIEAKKISDKKFTKDIISKLLRYTVLLVLNLNSYEENKFTNNRKAIEKN